MNKDKIYFLVLLIRVTFGNRHLRMSGIHLLYSFSMKNICHTEEDRFFVQQGLAFENCIKECALRSHCLELNYNRRTHICELFSTDDDGKQMQGSCVRVFSSDIEILERPSACDVCGYGETCEVDENGVGACLVKECMNTNLTKGDIEGNMKDVGKEIQYKCDEGYRERLGITTGVCLDTGQWNKNAVCVEEKNFAEGKIATQSSNYDNQSLAENAIDGNLLPDSPCAVTGTHQSEGWWQVDLGKAYDVKRVVVLTRTSNYGSKFRNVNVTVGLTTDPNDDILCASYMQEAPTSSKIELACNQLINGQYVRLNKTYIATEDVLPLCEVFVYLW